MKRILSLILSIAVIMSCIMIVPAFAATGTGTADDPIQITSAADFVQYFNKVDNNKDKYFELMNDITITDADGYVPTNTGFISFDGNNHTITWNYSGTSDYAGLFGRWYAYSDGVREIKDLTFDGSIEHTSTNYAGGFAYYTHVSGATDVTFNFTNLTNKADIKGQRGVGGILGCVYRGQQINFNNCVNEGRIISTTSGWGGAGGIVGFMFDGYDFTAPCTITNCVNYGNISSDINAGGIVGLVAYGGKTCNLTVSLCSNYGDVYWTGTNKNNGFGGIVGNYAGSATSTFKVEKSFNAGYVSTGTGVNLSGIVGRAANGMTIENCFNVGKLENTGTKSVYGGALGSDIVAGVTIRNFYQVGEIKSVAGSNYPVYRNYNGVKDITVENLYYINNNRYSAAEEATLVTEQELAALNLGDAWEKATITDNNIYPFPQLKGNEYILAPAGEDEVIENTVPQVFATGSAEDEYVADDEVAVTTDYAVVLTKCADIPFWSVEYGMLLSTDGVNFEEDGRAVATGKGDSGAYGILFWGTGLKGTYYVKPYATYSAPTGDKTITKYGNVVEFTME